MPNRIIKESIRTSKTVNEMTDFQFRVWVYLITYVDDYGRGSADPELIKGFVFPRRKRVAESDIKKALAELAGMGCILLYEIDGESYFCFPNWSEHQRIQTKRSKFPEPLNGKKEDSTVGHGDSPPESESESNPNPKQNPNPKPNTKEGPAKPPRSRFSPPSLEEVKAYCQERGSGVDPETFLDFYTANGWKQGRGKPIVDWKATVRTWEKRERTGEAPGGAGPGKQGGNVFMELLEEAYRDD